MPGEEVTNLEHQDHEVETLKSINTTEDDSSSSSPIVPNTNPSGSDGPPPDLNAFGEQVSIQSNSIRVGGTVHKPQSIEDLDKLVAANKIKKEHKKSYILTYEAWSHKKLPQKTTTEQGETPSPTTIESSGIINPQKLLPLTDETQEQDTTPLSMDGVLPKHQEEISRLRPGKKQGLDKTIPTPQNTSSEVTDTTTPNPMDGVDKVQEDTGEIIEEVDDTPVRDTDSPETDPDFIKVQNKVQKIGDETQEHSDPKTEVHEAHMSSTAPVNDVTSQANAKHLKKMEMVSEEQDEPAFDGAAFKALLLNQIKKILPKNEEEADEFGSNDDLDGVRDSASGQIKKEKTESVGDLTHTVDETPSTEGITKKEVKPLPNQEIGTTPKINTSVSPDEIGPQTAKKLSKDNTQEVDKKFKDGGITEEQLAISNEPEFLSTLDKKKTAHDDTESTGQNIVSEEQGMLQQSSKTSKKDGTSSITSMQGDRQGLLGNVQGMQQDTSDKDSKRRQEVADELDRIFNATKTDVDKILTDLDKQVMLLFDAAALIAKAKFESYVDRKMRAYKAERYSGVGGAFTWIGDAFTGLPEEVNEFFLQGRDLYIRVMDKCLTEIANFIAKKLNEAKKRLKEGKTEAMEYVEGLPEDLKQYGEEAYADIEQEFDALDASIDAKQDTLVTSLAQRYKESLEQVDARIEELKAANRGLIDIVLDAVEAVLEVIESIRKTLTKILKAAVQAIGAIIMDPIGFLDNLVAGVGGGFDNFMANIDQHLISGFVGWLTGAMSSVNIEMPDDIFSLSGIFSLVSQILGLTFDSLMERVTNVLGPEAVEVIMGGFQLFQVMATEGLVGAWEFLKDQFGDLQETIIGAVQEMLITQVIEAGIKWLLGLLNPVGAFVKAAMMIIDIVQFFINQGSQIIELVNAFIESISAIAGGAIGKATEMVEMALAKSIPVLIGFLAAILGIDGLAEKVQKIFKRIRKRVDTAIDGLVDRAASWFGKNKKGKKGKKKKDKRTDQQKKTDLDKGMRSGENIVKTEENSSEDIKKKTGQIENRFNLDDLDAKLVREKGEVEVWALSGGLGKFSKTKNIERPKTKAEGEEDVTEEDRKKHRKMVGEIENKLRAIPSEELESFEEYHKVIKQEAGTLERQYQPKVRKGINVSIDLVNPVKKDEQDGDIDVRIEIAPNTTLEDLQLIPEFQPLEESDIWKGSRKQLSALIQSLNNVTREYVGSINYNSVSEAKVMLKHIETSETSPQDAFLTFMPNSEKLVNDGEGGQCVGQAVDLVKRINAQLATQLKGARAYVVGATRQGDKAPSHGAGAIKYQQVQGDKVVDEGYILMDPGFNVKDSMRVKKSKALNTGRNTYTAQENAEGGDEIVSVSSNGKMIYTFHMDEITNPDIITKSSITLVSKFSIVKRAKAGSLNIVLKLTRPVIGGDTQVTLERGLKARENSIELDSVNLTSSDDLVTIFSRKEDELSSALGASEPQTIGQLLGYTDEWLLELLIGVFENRATISSLQEEFGPVIR